MASSLNEKDLAILGRNARAAFAVANDTLEKNDSIISKLPDAGVLRSEMQRFQLWAINLGLFRQDHSSLDYRLRDNEVIRSFTGELLTSLIEALGEVTSIASSSSEGSASIISETPTPDILRAEDDEPLSVSNDGVSSDSPIMMGDLNDENESLLTLHFEDVAEAINQMYTLASQIRSPKTRNIRTDVDLFKDVDIEIKSEYIKMRKRAELQGIEQILLQSRKIVMEYQTDEADLALTFEDQCLIQRLQKSNHTRRQQFEYWRKTKKRSIQAASEAIEMLSSSKHHDEWLTKILKHDTASWVRPSEFTRSLQSSVPPLPKDFVLNSNKSTYSGTSRGLTVHGPSGERVNWPKPPVTGNLEGDFECPFCFYICNAKYSKDAAWRTHLKHDLRPYICTYFGCTEPNVLYDSWEEWTHHEQWAHQQRIWRCSEHPQHEYVELAAYEDHVRTYHTAAMDQLLSSELLESQKTISQVCDRPCPFCQRDFEQPIDLQRHVAGHLESIALLSLPNLDDIDETSEEGKGNSNSANRNYAESKADDFDYTEPLIFSEDDHSGGTPVVPELDKELFALKLDAESTSFESMNEVNVESRQAYSIEIARRWLSRPPHELGEVSPLPLSSPKMSFGYVIGDLLALGQSCFEVYKKCVNLDRKVSDQVLALHSVAKKTKELLCQQNLNTEQKAMLTTYLDGCGNVLKDLDKYLIKYETLKRNSHRTSDRVGYLPHDMHDIQSRLISNVSKLDIFNRVLLQVPEIATAGESEEDSSSDDNDNVVSLEEPGTPDAFANTLTFRDQQGNVSRTSHWLPNVFNQSFPSTPLEITDEASVSFGEHEPETMASLDEGYVSLIELSTENGGLVVRLCSRPEDGRSRFVCHEVYPARPRKDCSIPLVSLNISRSGPFLNFNRLDQPNQASELWARLKFLSYERLALFFCSFLALRFEDNVSPIGKITDYCILKEQELFAGLLIDDYYEHALRLFREKDTGVIRLQASAHTGALKRKPIWTAFINDQILSPAWMSRDSSRVILLAHLQQYVFTEDYTPQTTAVGAYELTFVDSRDAEDFVRAIEKLRDGEKACRRDRAGDI